MEIKGRVVEVYYENSNCKLLKVELDEEYEIIDEKIPLNNKDDSTNNEKILQKKSREIIICVDPKISFRALLELKGKKIKADIKYKNCVSNCNILIKKFPEIFEINWIGVI